MLLVISTLARAQAPELPPAPAVETASEVPDPTFYSGRMVLYMSLIAPDGGLTDNDLEPLLKVQQDRPYSPQDVRQDINTLYRVGNFSQIEVDVQPGAYPGPDGEPILGVYVTYRVYPPPQLHRLHFEGNHVLSDRALSLAIGYVAGDQFFPEEVSSVEAAIRRAYAAKGWNQAQVQASIELGTAGAVNLNVQVTEGEPQRLDAIRIPKQTAISRVALQRLLWKHHLRQGQPYSASALKGLSEDLKALLLKKGYYEGRVRVTEAPGALGNELIIILEPQRQYRVHVDGRGLPSKAEVIRSLRLSEGVLISRYFAQEAGETLTHTLQARGYLDAQVAASLDEQPDTVTIHITGDSGPQFRLGATHFSGDEDRSQRFLRGALRQASPTMLTRGVVSPEAVDEALGVLKEYYRSQGNLSANLTLSAFERGRIHRNLLLKRVLPVTLKINIKPGVVTQLLSYTVDVPTIDITVDPKPLLDPLTGHPLNPSALDAACVALAQSYQEQGYLYADARPEVRVSSDKTEARVIVKVTPGPRVYLRSVLIQGQHRTRRSLIEEKVQIGPGQPLSPSELSSVRRRLYDMDLFSRVDVSAVGDEDRIKDLLVIVEERPNLYFEIGGSAATDQGIQAFGRAGHRNLFGLGHRLTLLGQAGVGWIGDGWVPDVQAPEWRLAARYEAPNVPTVGEQLAMDLIFNAQDQESYFRLERTGFAISLRLSLGGRSSAELAWRAQARRLLDADPALLLTQDPWTSLLGEDGASFPSDFRPWSGPVFSLLLDGRDDAFNPRKGVLGSLEVMVSDGLLARAVSAPQDASWIRSEAAISAHVPLGDGGMGVLFRLRGGLALVSGEQTLPLEDRFRLGGGSSMRGFDADSVGPSNRASTAALDLPDELAPIVAWASRNDQRWVPTGGDSLGLASIELKIPFVQLGLHGWDGWQMALFSDVGNVWFRNDDIRTDSMEANLNPLLRYDVGFGVRRSTAVGPIQVDVGFNPSPMYALGEEQLIKGFMPIHWNLSIGAF